MRTRTIYSAMIGAERETRIGIASHRYGPYKASQRDIRKSRQWVTFEQAVFRRLDERDALRAELAEARAFISTVIDAPKDYPAEEGM